MTRTGITSAIFRTPMGWAGAVASERGIVRVVLPHMSRGSVAKELAVFGRPSAPAAPSVLRQAVSQLQRYFSGRRTSFAVPLDLLHHTTFQQAVWKAAATIPFGETRTYGWIAKSIRRPKAGRAVGQAMGANPVPLLVP